MNTQAAFKTLVLVLSIGALMGFNEWRTVYGAPPEVRDQRNVAQCIKDRKAAAFRENALLFGREHVKQDNLIRSDCEAQQRTGFVIGEEVRRGN